MGADLSGTRIVTDEAGRQEFIGRCHLELRELALALARPHPKSQPTIGAETECFLAKFTGEPLPLSQAMLASLSTRGLSRWTHERLRSQLEHQATPRPLEKQPFTDLAAELTRDFQDLATLMRPWLALPGLIGILPTLSRQHLTADHVSDTARIRLIDSAYRRLYGEYTQIQINALTARTTGRALAGSTAAFQVHLGIAPNEFVATYNAAQLAAALVLAASGNSPYLLGHRLGHEARIPLLEQMRHGRCSFGSRWITKPSTIFAESLKQPPLLPAQLMPDESAPAGSLPALAHLRLHAGTVYHWNRPVYDPASGLRIENRSLPSGPTITDAVANAAFFFGLTLSLAPQMERITAQFPFGYARENFYAAGRDGLKTTLLWHHPSSRAYFAPAQGLILGRLQEAYEGLTQHGVDSVEASQWLGVFEQRVRSQQTGAAWQLQALERYGNDPSRMFEHYLRQSRGGLGQPVSLWSAP